MNPERIERPSVCLVNLGCHKNQVDAEVILGALDDAGFPVAADPSAAEIIIINTCGFLDAARRESIEMLAEMSRYRRDGVLRKLVVAGCMADRDRRWFEAHDFAPDLYVSSYDLDRIPERILFPEKSLPAKTPEDFIWPQSPRWVSTPRSYGFIKIADGCDNRCAYCRIPYLRGGFRSKARADIIAEAEELLETGRREIVLLSQDTTSYGSDRAGNGNFTNLVDELSQLAGLKWLRLMYLYPSRIPRRLLELMDSRETICRYLDIPLQHTHPEILKRMQRQRPGFAGERPMTAPEFIKAIRRAVPDVTIRTTLMTGFPGETDEIFDEMQAFVADGHVDHLGVFTWSPEPDTPAWQWADRADGAIAEARAAQLMETQADIVETGNRRLLGRVREIVVDSVERVDTAIMAEGRLMSQAPEVDGVVRIPGRWVPGQWLDVRLTGCSLYDFEAEGVGVYNGIC